MNSMYFITSARWSAERDFTCSISGSKSGGEKTRRNGVASSRFIVLDCYLRDIGAFCKLLLG